VERKAQARKKGVLSKGRSENFPLLLNAGEKSRKPERTWGQREKKGLEKKKMGADGRKRLA